jgi:hypothetical protein
LPPYPDWKNITAQVVFAVHTIAGIELPSDYSKGFAALYYALCSISCRNPPEADS